MIDIREQMIEIMAESEDYILVGIKDDGKPLLKCSVVTSLEPESLTDVLVDLAQAHLEGQGVSKH